MRVALAVVVPLAAALLQGALVPFIEVGGAHPNLVILVAACWAVAAGPREAVWWAFVGGLAADLLSAGAVGALALASLIPVAALGLAETPGRQRSVLTGAFLVGLASLAAGLIYLAVLAIAGIPLGELSRLLAAAVSGAIYNGVLAIATYPLMRMLRRGTEKQASLGW